MSLPFADASRIDNRAKRGVFIFSAAHPIDDTRIAAREALSLDQYYDVTLVACGEASQTRPFGIETVLLPPTKNRLDRLRRLRSLLRLCRKLPPSVIHVHELESFAAAVALRGTKHRVVIDLHEDYALQQHHKPRIPPRLRPVAAFVVRGWVNGTCRLADGVVSASQEIQDGCVVPSALVRNFPRTDESADPERFPYLQRDDLVVSISTNTRERAFFEMIDALDRVAQSGAIPSVAAGPVHGDELRLRAERAHELVEVPGRLDRAEVAELLGRATIGLNLLHRAPQYERARPTKLFEYMLAGLPVVSANFGPSRELVEDAGCGILVDTTDPDEIAEAIRTLQSDRQAAFDMGASGRRFVLDRFTWESEAHSLLELYEQLTTLEGSRCVVQ